MPNIPARGFRTLSAVTTKGYATHDGQPVIGDPRIYKYAPQSALALGKGFSPADLQDFKAHFLNFTPSQIDAGSGTRKVSAFYVSSFFEFQAATQTDLKASASAWGASGNAATSFDLKASYVQSSITIILNGTADYGRWSIGTNYNLREDAAALMNNDPVKFLKRYGTRFVESERRGASINVILEIDGASSKLQTALKSSASVGGSYGAISGSASASLSVELSAAAKQGRLRISVYAVGANDAGLQASLIALAKAESDPLAAMTSSVASMLGALKPEDGVPVEYYISDMESIGVDTSKIDIWTDYSEYMLREYVLAYRMTLAELQVLDQINDPASTFGILIRHKSMGVEDFIRFLNSRKSELTEYISELGDAHKNLKAGGAPDEIILARRPKLIPEFYLKSLFSPPTIEYWIHNFTVDQVRRVLAAPYADRLEVAKSIDPKLTGLAITSGLRGIGISSAANRSIYSDGDVKTSEFGAVSGGGAWIFYMNPPNQIENTQDTTLAWAAKHTGKFEVDECIVVRDIANREFVVPSMHLSFEAKGGNLDRMDMNIIL